MVRVLSHIQHRTNRVWELFVCMFFCAMLHCSIWYIYFSQEIRRLIKVSFIIRHRNNHENERERRNGAILCWRGVFRRWPFNAALWLLWKCVLQERKAGTHIQNEQRVLFQSDFWKQNFERGENPFRIGWSKKDHERTSCIYLHGFVWFCFWKTARSIKRKGQGNAQTRDSTS